MSFHVFASLLVWLQTTQKSNIKAYNSVIISSVFFKNISNLDITLCKPMYERKKVIFSRANSAKQKKTKKISLEENDYVHNTIIIKIIVSFIPAFFILWLFNSNHLWPCITIEQYLVEEGLCPLYFLQLKDWPKSDDLHKW